MASCGFARLRDRGGDGRRPGATLCGACRGDGAVSRRQPAPGAGIHGRRGRGPARLSRRGVRHRRLAGGRLAWLVSAPRVPAVRGWTRRRRCSRRPLRGERVWEAHRTHYYQRLHQLGARHRRHSRRLRRPDGGHRRDGARACWRSRRPPAGGRWAAWTAILAALFARIDYHWSRKRFPP